MEILMVEDDYLDAMNVQRSLNKLNLTHKLHIARNGKDALDLLTGMGGEKVANPDLILLDLNMPKMSGLEFLKNLRAIDQYRRTNVFIMTTSEEESEREEAARLGISGYIIKPVTFDKFDNAHSSMDNFNLLMTLLKS
jgi:CheY-like chemotaxis protein